MNIENSFIITISLVISCCALSPRARAVCEEGCDLTLNNTLLGDSVLYSNTTGVRNTAIGNFALFFNTVGIRNTAVGIDSLNTNRKGKSNTAIGYSALAGNDTGNNNIALGDRAGSFLTTGSDNIDIGHKGHAGEAQTIRIGQQGTQTNTYIAGINAVTVAGGIAVVIDSNGHLGTMNSSTLYKENIQPMDKASEAILSLQPVTFRYKKDLDPKAIPQFGLVAEEVEKVNPDLVGRDEQGKPYTVRYEAVNAMLLNEFLKEHRKVEKLETTVEQQQKQIAALASQMQQVSEQLRANKLSPQLIVDN